MAPTPSRLLCSRDPASSLSSQNIKDYIYMNYVTSFSCSSLVDPFIQVSATQRIVNFSISAILHEKLSYQIAPFPLPLLFRK